MTCEPFPQPAPPNGESMSSSGDSPARTLVLQDMGGGLRGSAPDYGPNCFGSLAFFDRDTSSWRMWQHCFIEGWQPFSESFPSSGMTRSGVLFPRARWLLHTHGSECSLWPTPTASMGKKGWGISLTCHHGYRPDVAARCDVSGWKPHPELIEVLMGFPQKWTDLEGSETPLCPK